jgi:hypothetical protein
MKKYLFSCLCFLALVQCKKDEDPSAMPSNLILTVEATNDGTGHVTIEATADNTEYFKFYLGETTNETPIQTTNGLVSYTYKSPGTFTITVQAHADESNFISESTEVEIDLSIPIPTTGYSTPSSYSGKILIWNDEFSGAIVDETKWTFEIGTGCPNCGWGNNELEYYRKENTSIVEGNLIIEAKAESFGAMAYTSSRLITKGKLDFKYGRVDVRAALPKGQGLWPAIWMLGSNISTVGWPACGEIDIMEMVGGEGRDNRIYGTAHWDNAGSYANYGGNYALSSGIFNNEFHVFSITWDANYIRWFMDDIQYHEILITPTGLSEFHETYFMILNVAVGGNWPGSPDGTTKFPQRMIVDYVRVFQNQ